MLQGGGIKRPNPEANPSPRSYPCQIRIRGAGGGGRRTVRPNPQANPSSRSSQHASGGGGGGYKDQPGNANSSFTSTPPQLHPEHQPVTKGRRQPALFPTPQDSRPFLLGKLTFSRRGRPRADHGAPRPPFLPHQQSHFLGESGRKTLPPPFPPQQTHFLLERVAESQSRPS